MGKSLTFAALLIAAVSVAGGQNEDSESFAERLQALDSRLRELGPEGGLPDPEHYRPAAVRGRFERLLEARAELARMNARQQPVSSRVDYLLVAARSNDLLFEHQTTKPWARDPMFYLEPIRRYPYPDPAVDPELLRRRLEQVPEWLEAARANLTEVAGELAGIALFHLENYDGVGQGEPLRDPPPAGILGWYRELEKRTAQAEPAMRDEARAAAGAVESFRDWLRQRRESFDAPAHLGWTRYQWYLHNVRLMPFTVSEVQAIGSRELARSRTLWEIERRRNRDLAPRELAADEREYAGRVAEAERRIRETIERLELLTIPDGLGAFETDAFWRAGMKRHFWEEIQYRDAHNNHIHASIPGHRFDRLLARRVEDPLRGGFQDGGRAEGWAYYVESLLLHSGLLDDRPRARELFYIAEIARAVRIPIELRMQSGESSLEEAVREMVRRVPLMEENLARYDLEIYLRRPAYGMNYVMGRVQLEQLLAERSVALGEDFDLGAFHDRFLSYGWIPITLIGWEMNGWDERAEAFWEARLAELGRGR